MSSRKEAICEIETKVSVPFFDTDPMGVTWHGNYIKYFEIARCKLLDKIDFGYIKMVEAGHSWPVVDLRVKYVKPSIFGQDILIWAGIIEYENRLKIEYRITDQHGGEVITKGFTIQVAVDNQTGEMCFASPTILKTKLGIE